MSVVVYSKKKKKIKKKKGKTGEERKIKIKKNTDKCYCGCCAKDEKNNKKG